MVKKGQTKGGKPGGGGGAKKTTSASTTGDDSFIVFSNSDKEPKARRPADATNHAGPSGANVDGPSILGEAPKRPDVKKLIGGASWTGKLPVNLLSEHCQKQKWEKPDYSMVRSESLSWDVAKMCVTVEVARRLLLDGHSSSEESEDSGDGSNPLIQTSADTQTPRCKTNCS
jgi:hypothetical protein